jgi:hypothetical protein
LIGPPSHREAQQDLDDVAEPVIAMTAVRSLAASGSAISERSGGSTVTIAASASNMALATADGNPSARLVDGADGSANRV